VIRAQADALEIEAGAKRRLANEYDGAQERGELVGAHGAAKKRVGGADPIATAKEAGFTKQQIAEARAVRDAEKNDPGVVRRTVRFKSILRQLVALTHSRFLFPKKFWV
jgi:hypothetical protein